MKCPKCQYLGFDAGHRCRNCGYDFSLLALADAPASEPDLFLRPAERAAGSDGASARRVDLPLRVTPPGAPVARAADTPREGGAPGGEAPGASGIRIGTAPLPPSPARSGLPLFPSDASDDEPLVTIPPAPRAPLAVRKTPEVPRAARDPRPVRRHGGPVFERSAPESAHAAPASAAVLPARAPVRRETCGPRPRVMAALVDLSILLALDLVIAYFTLRMAGLTAAEWRLLPMLPMSLFLLGVKVAYFSAFTAIGGQTIGKMALRIRVVSEEDRSVGPALAIGRTLAAAVSAVSLGAGFVPALFDGGRALHDRVARTRVVPVDSVA
jgi:uncharacterized RDD family membrane protein YckC